MPSRALLAFAILAGCAGEPPPRTPAAPAPPAAIVEASRAIEPAEGPSLICAKLGMPMTRPASVAAVTLSILAAACATRPPPPPSTTKAAPSERPPPPATSALAPTALPLAAEPAVSTARTFAIPDASKRYEFRLTFPDGCPEPEKVEACRGPAELVIVPRDGSAPRTIHLDSAWVEADAQGNVVVNSTELYGEPGTIDVGDIDFDGREDFAVLSGMSGPYGGPTFTVFLATASGDFVRSEALSRLTEETLGLFQVDTKRKRLVTSSKSGCCFHVTEELAMVNGKPVPVSRETEDGTGDALVLTHERRVGGTWRKTTERRPLPK